MTLNDDRLSGERKSPSEPSVTVMGKPIPRKENRDKSQNYGLNFSDMIGEYERVYDNETGNIYRAYDGFLDDIGSDQTRYSAITDSQYAEGYVGWIDK